MLPKSESAETGPAGRPDEPDPAPVKQGGSPLIGQLATAILFPALLSFASSVFVPLFFSLFLIALALPVQSLLQRRMPKLVALLVTLALTVIVIVTVGSTVVWGFWQTRSVALPECRALPKLFPRSSLDRRQSEAARSGWPIRENLGETMRYIRPLSMEDAVGLMAGSAGTAAILAGGSDLLVRMKGGFIEPDLIVDIKAIEGLNEIRETAEGFSIGAAVPCALLAENLALQNGWPGVVEAARLIGSKQVQGRCTIVGNLCNASPAADSVPALVVAGARASIVGPEGRRTAPVETVPVGPGKTSLAKGEIIDAILLANRLPHSGDAYLRFIPRTEMDIAVVSTGVNLTLDEEGVIVAARLALGAAAPTVLLVEDAAEVLIGSKLDEATLERLAKVCSEACRPIDDKRGTVEFRRKVAGVLAKRVAVAAYSRAGGR